MGLRNHRDKAIGKKNRVKKTPSQDQIKIKVKNDTEEYNEIAKQCPLCGLWFGIDDFELGICFNCNEQIDKEDQQRSEDEI